MSMSSSRVPPASRGLYCISTPEMRDLRLLRGQKPVLKVGCSATDVRHRLDSGYRTYCPDGIYILGVVIMHGNRRLIRAAEMWVHAKLHSYTPVSGKVGEWFVNEPHQVHRVFRQLKQEPLFQRHVRQVMWWGPIPVPRAVATPDVPANTPPPPRTT